ncbi:MAG: dockerin type I domain-containing protein, partial [Pirellula sp.]
LIINLLNSTGASIPVDQLPPPPPFYDVNGNGFVDATDVLSLVDYINSTGNSGSGEGEQDGVEGTSRLAIGLLAAPQPEVVEQAVLYNMAGAQANAWATLSDEAELYGPTLFPIDSEDENAVEFWASFAQGNDERIDSNDIDDEFLKGTWM